MALRIYTAISVIFFFCQSNLFGQTLTLDQNGNVTEFGLVNSGQAIANYRLEKSSGNFSVYLKDENLKNINFFETNLGNGIRDLAWDLFDGKVVFVASGDPFQSSRKTILLGHLETGSFQKFSFNSSIMIPSKIKAIKNGVVIQMSIEGGCLLEVYDFEMQSVHTVTELLGSNLRVVDMNGGEHSDVLILEEKKDFNQSLQVVSYDHQGTRMMNIQVDLPFKEKSYIQHAKLVDFGEGIRIVGTYSHKKGEWFSGYFDLLIDEEMKTHFETFRFRDFEGFYDYRKSPSKKVRKRLNKEVHLLDAVSDGQSVAMAAVFPSYDRKFIHFIQIDAEGKKVFDKSVKVYYNSSLLWSPYHFTLDEGTLYFAYRGNQNRRNPPGEKIFMLEKDIHSKDLEIRKSVVRKDKLWKIDVPNYQYWYNGKFLVYGVSRTQTSSPGKPVFIVEAIDADE